jgi:hypothetical protein
MKNVFSNVNVFSNLKKPLLDNRVENEEDMTDVYCTLCCGDIKEPESIRIQCFHTFHVICLSKWPYDNCPICDKKSHWTPPKPKKHIPKNLQGIVEHATKTVCTIPKKDVQRHMNFRRYGKTFDLYVNILSCDGYGLTLIDDEAVYHCLIDTSRSYDNTVIMDITILEFYENFTIVEIK